MIFILLDFNEIHKKQFSAFDIVESRVNTCGLFTCNLCWHDSTSFFTSMINIFTFRCANLETYDYYYYFANRMTRHNSPNCPYNNNNKNRLPSPMHFLGLIYTATKFHFKQTILYFGTKFAQNGSFISKKRKRKHHHWILHNQISLGTNF